MTRNGSEGGTIVARATVNLPGLPVGSEVTVDPAVPYIADQLAAEFLVPVGPEPVGPEPVSEE